jgi:hypothetical protein
MDGVPGPAQEAWGLTTEQYAAEIKRVEIELARDYEGATDGKPLVVSERLMDSRAGNSSVHGRTYISEFSEHGLDFYDASGKALNARSDNPDGVCGVSLITDALGYDTQKPVGPGNRPRFMIVYAPTGCRRRRRNAAWLRQHLGQPQELDRRGRPQRRTERLHRPVSLRATRSHGACRQRRAASAARGALLTSSYASSGA